MIFVFGLEYFELLPRTTYIRLVHDMEAYRQTFGTEWSGLKLVGIRSMILYTLRECV